MTEPKANRGNGKTRFEYAIAEAMAAHDDEAPREADLLRTLSRASSPAPGQRSRTPGRRAPQWYLVPLAAAAAVAAIAVGSAWAGGLFDIKRPSPQVRAGHPVKLRCPPRYAGVAPWVPALPAHVNGSDRLVPRRAPTSAVMCAYVGTNVEKRQSGWKLSGRRVLTAGFGDLAELLHWQLPRAINQQIACTQVGGKQVNYLIGLTYRGHGRIWVAATDDPNSCVGTSNGVFTGPGNVGWFATKAFASGRWPAQTPISCHLGYGDVGRFGQDHAMVPAGSTKLLICARGGRTLTSGYQSLVSALNALPTFPSTEACSQAPGPERLVELYFFYRQGPPVNVSVFRGCSPAINNTSLQATSARTILPIIQRLLNS